MARIVAISQMKNILFVVIVTWSAGLSADVPADEVTEVNHLLDYIRHSDCVMERNGSKHSTVEAIEHILNKYDHFRDEIKSTEDFIRLSATKSTLSGDYYLVKCPGENAVRTKDWLLSELKRYRTE